MLATFVRDVWAPRARRRLAARTWERDSIVYERHIRPVLGERPMARLDVEDLVGWQDGLEEAGVGAPTMIKAIGILSGIFGEAARRPRSTGVHSNPVALLKRPSATGEIEAARELVWGSRRRSVLGRSGSGDAPHPQQQSRRRGDLAADVGGEP